MGLAFTSVVSVTGPVLDRVELRFNAADADATNPPAPRVEVGIIHGIEGFVGDDDSRVVIGGNDSVRESCSSNCCRGREGDDRDAVKRDTVEYGELDILSFADSRGMSSREIMVRNVLSRVYCQPSEMCRECTLRTPGGPTLYVDSLRSEYPPSPPSVALMNPTGFSFWRKNSAFRPRSISPTFSRSILRSSGAPRVGESSLSFAASFQRV